MQRQNNSFDYAAECGEQGLIDTAPFKATLSGFYFSYFFLNKRLNLGASTCHLETDIDFLPLKIKTSTACSLAALDVPADSLMYLQTKYNMQTARKDSSLLDMLKDIRKIAAAF